MQSKEELEREQSQKYSDKQKCENEIDQLKNEISRLKKFKKYVSDYKYDMIDFSIKYGERFGYYSGLSDKGWKGEKCNIFMNKTDTVISPDFYDYNTSVDNMLDRVCDEIRELENKVHDKEIILGNIKKSLNNIATALEKWAN